jgi:hypothetical protein
MFFPPVGWDYERAIDMDGVRCCGRHSSWRQLAAPNPTEEVAHVHSGDRATTMRDFTRRTALGRAPGVMDSLTLNRRAFTENHGLNR